ncbi:hypothetical protein N7499_003092 [Penicillium canescens]|uniref:Uncharacterized protein n=1 Tax=Penicillium canescens TaxID=5083 RepID=A0AAD6N7S4_PENCN|nr:uncharacterized protein N7446_011964 [Penicillium canescens]KAJ6019807.1 hypothetical protein N7522_000515 [Penicillium canescens]KAJ6039100.1 hypothetical protein N7460_007132 [Penicillium canescens]KAJ6047130.1 hypothetical protein N7446_011964 [Penicillium canescens]KAJ6093761.1 hypothetical protein N7499_003092 [Penicillium canescens]KAJ6174445.1 hypothetical protein N7485_005511 [Penicillium canescens]
MAFQLRRLGWSVVVVVQMSSIIRIGRWYEWARHSWAISGARKESNISSKPPYNNQKDILKMNK